MFQLYISMLQLKQLNLQYTVNSIKELISTHEDKDKNNSMVTKILTMIPFNNKSWEVECITNQDLVM